jgi:hypothetical protein
MSFSSVPSCQTTVAFESVHRTYDFKREQKPRRHLTQLFFTSTATIEPDENLFSFGGQCFFLGLILVNLYVEISPLLSDSSSSSVHQSSSVSIGSAQHEFVNVELSVLGTLSGKCCNDFFLIHSRFLSKMSVGFNFNKWRSHITKCSV